MHYYLSDVNKLNIIQRSVISREIYEGINDVIKKHDHTTTDNNEYLIPITDVEVSDLDYVHYVEQKDEKIKRNQDDSAIVKDVN